MKGSNMKEQTTEAWAWNVVQVLESVCLGLQNDRSELLFVF